MRSSSAIRWAGVVPLLLGVVFLADWLVPGARFGWMGAPDPALAPNSALAFALCGGAILALAQRTPRGRRLARALAALVAVCALLRFAVNAAGGGASFRAYLLGATAQANGFVLTDAGSISAVNFLLAAAALALLAWPGRIRTGATLAALLAVALGLGGQAFLGRFVIGAQPDPSTFWISVVRSMLFAIIAIGLFRLAVQESQRANERENSPDGRAYLDVEHGVAAAFGLALGLVGLAGLLSYNLVTRFVEDGRRADANQHLVMALNDLHTNLRDAEAAARGYVASGDPGALRDFRQAAIQLEPSWRSAGALSLATGRMEAMAHLEPSIRAMRLRVQEAVGARQENRLGAARQALVALEAERLDDRVADEVRAIEAAARPDLADEAMRREAGRARTLVAFAACAGSVGLIVVLLHRRFETDLAGRRRAEATLRRHNETLKSFAHTVAHDLRAPLRGIAGYARELADHAPGLDERARFCVTQIDAAAKHLDHLIEGTLDYTRVDAATPELVAVDVAALTARLLRQRAPQIEEYRTEVVTRFGVPRVESWEHGVAQVLGNLLDNALKYSRGGPAPRVQIETEATPAGWRLTVRDNGIGFDMKYHDRIFGLFQRLPNSREFEGTGAGLAIVRKVVERLGGTVRAESAPGAGAAFIVELPRRPVAALA